MYKDPHVPSPSCIFPAISYLLALPLPATTRCPHVSMPSVWNLLPLFPLKIFPPLPQIGLIFLSLCSPNISWIILSQQSAKELLLIFLRSIMETSRPKIPWEQYRDSCRCALWGLCARPGTRMMLNKVVSGMNDGVSASYNISSTSLLLILPYLNFKESSVDLFSFFSMTFVSLLSLEPWLHHLLWWHKIRRDLQTKEQPPGPLLQRPQCPYSRVLCPEFHNKII